MIDVSTYHKFVKLHTRITINSKIPKHNTDVKWCDDMANKINEGTIPSKGDLEIANILWKRYK